MQVNYPEPRRNHAVKDVNSIEIHNLYLPVPSLARVLVILIATVCDFALQHD